MPKLHLKRTPAEEAEHLRKKAKKAARRAASAREADRSRSRSPRRTTHATTDPKKYSFVYAEDVDDGEEEYGPQPAGQPGPSFTKRATNAVEEDDYEEERFAAKMRDALADDGLYDPLQRLDGVEARLNSYTHVPRRWQGTDEGFNAALWMEDAREELGGLEPWQMNDDEYAEYMRAGMWRKQHAAEFQERLRRKEEREARKQRERQLREETKRLEREAQEDRDARRAARVRKRREAARASYDRQWAKLLERQSNSESSVAKLTFDDIPWPVAPPANEMSSITVDDISPGLISSFLLPTNPMDMPPDDSSPAKDVLRATMLRFHPDKFEARVLSRVREKDKDRVKEVADVVVRALNSLMKENASKSS